MEAGRKKNIKNVGQATYYKGMAKRMSSSVGEKNLSSLSLQHKNMLLEKEPNKNRGRRKNISLLQGKGKNILWQISLL